MRRRVHLAAMLKARPMTSPIPTRFGSQRSQVRAVSATMCSAPSLRARATGRLSPSDPSTWGTPPCA